MIFKSAPRQNIFAGQRASGAPTGAPEINLIPFIDVLLVILIFLMISTTFTRYQELSITLPNAEGAISKGQVKDIAVAITSDGRIAINGKRVRADELSKALSAAGGSTNNNDKGPTVTIAADGKAPHQIVMQVMEAARNANLPNVVFATQSTSKN